MDDNTTKQNDEFELLQAVYPDLLDIIDEKNYKIRLYNTFDENPLILTIRYVEDYPSNGPPSFEVYAEWLNDETISNYISHMIDMYIDNMCDVIVYNWINYLQDEITSDTFLIERKKSRLGQKYISLNSSTNDKMNMQSSASVFNEYEYIDDSDDDNVTSMKTSENSQNKIIKNSDVVIESQLPIIFHSDDFVDRKSVFRSHCAEIHSVEEAYRVRNSLISSKPMDKATHNMWAYRIYDEQKGIWFEDNDDDGEAMAGSKMAHLLSILEVKNVFVMVSRWFGGILLGPDRFKHINNMTRSILDQHDYINQKHQKKRK